MKPRTLRCWLVGGIVGTVATLLSCSGSAASDAYSSAVTADGPVAYYRFNDSQTRTLINLNSGSLGAAGNASNDLASVTLGVVDSIPGAIAGDPDRAEFFDFTTRTEIPFNSALNTPSDKPFSVEAWFYPVSDQVSTGMSPLANRYTQGTTRQGWVMYQRAPDENHCTTCGPGVGWEVRMYNNQDTSGHLDVTSGVGFTLGKWQHVVFVYDPVQVTNATLTIYVDGVPAATNVWAATDGVTPGYYPNLGDNAVQPNGPPAMSLGGYNNANSGTYGFANPWIGGIDEFAWYSNALSPAQILAHYQNGTNAARSTPYANLIQSDHPVEYLRLDEVASGPDVAVNFGDQRSAGDGTNTPAIKHPGSGPLAGRTDSGSHSSHYRDTGASGHAFTSIPWTAGNNPDAGTPFTVEFWTKPTGDQMNPGPSPINNRVANGITDRTGWVIYQRDPNASYQGPPSVPGESGIGWTFRMYTGNGGSGNDVLTGQPYKLGEWQHLVFTWSPQTDNGASASGSEQWNGILTAYVDGVAAASNTTASYAANTNPTEDPANHPPADLAIGSYNLASGLGEEFEGDISQVAIYSNLVLTADQVLAHYMAGTNAQPSTNYETLVFTAAAEQATPTIPERATLPATYLPLNEPAFVPGTNSGTLGGFAPATLVLTTNTASGPAGSGFVAANSAVPLNGTNAWVSLNDPAGLNFPNQITLEAWVKPDATQGDLARIISHGPPTSTVYDTNTYPIELSGSQLSSNEVFLRIEGGTNYSVGTSDGFTFHGATAAVPAGDLGGGWIYLAGTYDGTHWNLYRNGVQIATVTDSQGALPVTAAEWAIGATGMGWADFFAGAIDEVAIYNKALSPSQVQAHYNSATVSAVALHITKSGSSYVITYDSGTLQSSPTVNGTYNTVPGANSPYTVPAGTSVMFYRVKL
ncbi:MAG TPA: LamG-like jellyroll fold domain-containing protein [Candidatus Limnocylindrales bacterium]|nr:LamG-like jellyroll fold domain-containing protein [Candidatus Limnocylindrales bacterium]